MQEVKKYHIKTWGCQMNVYDSQRIGEILCSIGYSKVDSSSEADVVILNTCHIREKATEKVYSDLGRLKNLKERRAKIGKSLIVAVSGCIAQAQGEEIIKRAPYVDIVFGPQTWHKLPDMIAKLKADQVPLCDIDFSVSDKFDNLTGYFDKTRIVYGAAFLAIQEGCDKFCTYCVVPYTRGAEYSRPLFQVVSEVKQLVLHGAKEITLLGQNVNAYHGLDYDHKEITFGTLLRILAKIEGLQIIRYVTSYPAEVDDDLIRAHGDVMKLSPFVHLPIQSGSNRILEKMNRRHTKESYLKVVERFHQVRADLAFSSDFIVGFPGETDDDFAETLDVISKVNFIQSFSFKYSIRPGTPAATMKNQISEEVKDIRLNKLQNLLIKNQKNFNEQSIGREFEIILTRKGKRPNQLVGKSPYMQAVVIDDIDDDAMLLGSMVKVKITEGYNNSLKGVIL